MVQIFRLDTDNALDSEGIGWSGIDIPAAAEPYAYPASKLRDAVRQAARSSSLDYGRIAGVANKTTGTPLDTTLSGESASYEQALDTSGLASRSLQGTKRPRKTS